VPESTSPYARLQAECALHNATLVAVCKTRTTAEILKLYQQGQRIFAENRVQELVAKAPSLPADIEWHLIGHLQTNKVKTILPYVTLIHSLDRESLWTALDREAEKRREPISCLLQIKVAAEESKFGWHMQDLRDQLAGGILKRHPSVQITGVMGMATFTDDREQVRREMRELHGYFEELRAQYFSGDTGFRILSMGMSGDYDIALTEGSNMIRIGSLLFADS